MHLIALVVTLCSLQTMQCNNYVVRLYATRTACQINAIGVRELRRDGPLFVRCVPTGANP